MNENPGNVPEEMAEVSPSTDVSGGFWSSLIDIFIDPVKVFRRIEAGMRWWKPFIVIAIATAVITWFQNPINVQVVRLNERGVSEDQLQTQLEVMGKFGFVGILAAPIVVLIIYLVLAALCNVAVNLVSGRSGFKKMLCLISFVSFVSLIDQGLRLLIIHMRGIENIASRSELTSVSFSLTRFIEVEGFQRALLDSFSIFGIWFLVLFTIGSSVVYGISRKAALVPTIVIWVLGVLMGMLQGLSG